jgi:hypothetical protein
MFRNKAIFLLVISAIIIPLMFMVEDIIALATLIVIFIACQALMLYFFYKEETLKFEHWFAFWAAVISLGFMLFVVLTGRSSTSEILALLVFIIYFIELLILLFKGRFQPKRKKAEKKQSKEGTDEKDLESFREKDELQELAEFFEPELKSKARIVDMEEPRIEKIVYDAYDEEEPKHEDKDFTNFLIEEQESKDEENNGWAADIPRSMVFDYDEKKTQEIPEIKELKEAPKVNFDKVKRDLEKIDDGVKNISEKIRLISEKAILEGAEKKLRELEEKIAPKPKKKELNVYAAKEGSKYHYKKSCLSLRRVKGKNLLIFTNSDEARKKGLKACGMCK